MSYSSIMLWSLAILLLDDYLTDEENQHKDISLEDFKSQKIKKKKKNIQVLGVDIIDQRLFKQRRSCSICFIDFGYFKWQYHCYLCAGSVCWECSTFSVNSKKSCDVCFYKFSDVQREVSKEKILNQMEKASMTYIKKQNDFERTTMKIIKLIPSDEDTQKIKVTSQESLLNLERRLMLMKIHHQNLLKQIEQHQN